MVENTSEGAWPIVFNAEIESADIRIERGFILTAWVHLKWDGQGQGFGGYVLGGTPFDDALCARHEDQTNLAADFIGGILAVAGVDSFKALTGKIIRVAKDDSWGDILAIGHPVKERWYVPKDRFALLAERQKGGDA